MSTEFKIIFLHVNSPAALQPSFTGESRSLSSWDPWPQNAHSYSSSSLNYYQSSSVCDNFMVQRSKEDHCVICFMPVTALSYLELRVRFVCVSERRQQRRQAETEVRLRFDICQWLKFENSKRTRSLQNSSTNDIEV